MKDYTIHPSLRRKMPVIDYGKGVYLYDKDGNRYLDGCGGAMTASIGHAVPEIVEAMREQASKITFAYRFQFTSEPAQKLSSMIAEMAPGSVNWSFYANSGSEATELAIKMARKYFLDKGQPSKYWIISRWTSYHGITLGALSLSGNIRRRFRYTPLLHNFPDMYPPYCYNCLFEKTYPECNCYCARQLEHVIHQITPEYVAGFISEPLIGASGAAIYGPPEYYKIIREICDEYDVLLIADEVITGFGRTGKNFGIEHWDVEPDIICFGKGVSAGYTPLSGITVSDEIYNTIKEGSGTFAPGHTLASNPLSTAVGYRVLQYIKEHNLVEASREKGEYLKKRFEELMEKHPMIGEVRGKGLMLGIEFVKDREKKVFFEAAEGATEAVVKGCFDNGLIIYPAKGAYNGVKGDSILITPPLVINKEEMDEMVEILDKVIGEAESKLL